MCGVDLHSNNIDKRKFMGIGPVECGPYHPSIAGITGYLADTLDL